MEAALSSKEVEQMRLRFSSWLRWLMAIRPSDFPTQRALARALSLSDASITYLLKGDRSPSVETAMAVSRLADFPVDFMLKNPPPSANPKAKR